MKTLKVLALCAVSALFMASCCNNTYSERLPGISKGQMDSVGYAVGVSFGNMIKASKMQGIEFSEIEKGMFDMLNGKEKKISDEQIGMIIDRYMAMADQAIGVAKKEEQGKFFEENKKQNGVKETESGLQYRIDQEGNNEVMATAQDTVEVHYTGKLLDGTEFDSSIGRGETAKFPLNAVIPGWTEGIQLVGEGGKITLWIPYELGYGSRDMGPNLPGYSTLVFDVELIKVHKFVPQKETKGKK